MAHNKNISTQKERFWWKI